MPFIYVMSEEDKQKMIALGYELVRDDAWNGVFIFAAKDKASFADSDELDKLGIRHANSNVMSF